VRPGGGTTTVNRAELQQLAEDRILDAQALLAAGRWSAAYYLSGYAVECGLKACILAHVTIEIVFENRRFSDRCWTHDLEEMIRLTGLEPQYVRDLAANPALGNHWVIVRDWDERSRYTQKTEAEARGLFDAVVDNANGVMSWIRARW
jgi:HEPN domain-containing protein